MATDLVHVDPISRREHEAHAIGDMLHHLCTLPTKYFARSLISSMYCTSAHKRKTEMNASLGRMEMLMPTGVSATATSIGADPTAVGSATTPATGTSAAGGAGGSAASVAAERRWVVVRVGVIQGLNEPTSDDSRSCTRPARPWIGGRDRDPPLRVTGRAGRGLLITRLLSAGGLSGLRRAALSDGS